MDERVLFVYADASPVYDNTHLPKCVIFYYLVISLSNMLSCACDV